MHSTVQLAKGGRQQCCVNKLLLAITVTSGMECKGLLRSFHFQLAVKTCPTCQDISFLHHFPDIILVTLPARGTSQSYLVTSFTWNSKNSDSRIIPCARTVFFRFSMDATGLHRR